MVEIGYNNQGFHLCENLVLIARSTTIFSYNEINDDEYYVLNQVPHQIRFRKRCSLPH